MAGLIRARPIARLALVASLVTLAVGASAAMPVASASALSRWTGGIDLYRTGVFTTQQTWLWCTAADVQIIRNIVDRQSDHSRSSQQRYFDYMRAHNRYDIPLKDGVDPGGWTAGLRHFVDGRYRLVASRSFDSALRSAVTNLRKTNLPVAITVSHGNHAWVLTGFTATADPAVTSRFTVTSVRVVGPLWGLQSRSYGYDMRPDTKLTPSQLRGFFTPWHYTSVPMAWENRWVSIQPVPTTTSVSKAVKPPAPSLPPPGGAAAASAGPSAAPASPPAAASPGDVAMLAEPPASDPGPNGATAADGRTDDGSAAFAASAGSVAALLGLAMLGVLLVRARSAILRRSSR
ncbi:MAG TPA: hypothetical protein VNM34_07270 [Verrucomicrobiae bacterium]|nr:hypothetical protein [Verrucomicrobiae bacterium]